MLAWVMQAATEPSPGAWEWIKLIGGLLLAPGVLAFAFAAYKAYQRGELAKFVYATIQDYKKDRATADRPEDAKILTRAIGNGLDGLPRLKAEHERLLRAAGANAESILGPVIARLAGRSQEAGSA